MSDRDLLPCNPSNTHRDLLLCTLFLGSASSMSSSPSSSPARERERSRLRPLDSERARASALLVSMPIAPRDFCSAGKEQGMVTSIRHRVL